MPALRAVAPPFQEILPVGDPPGRAVDDAAEYSSGHSGQYADVSGHGRPHLTYTHFLPISQLSFTSASFTTTRITMVPGSPCQVTPSIVIVSYSL